MAAAERRVREIENAQEGNTWIRSIARSVGGYGREGYGSDWEGYGIERGKGAVSIRRVGYGSEEERGCSSTATWNH